MTDSSKDFPARLVYQPLLGFIEQVASKSPAPGGGSAAALAGALGSALLVMVANLTVGKKNYADVAQQMSELRSRLDDLRNKLTARIDDDTAAFNRMRAAAKMPERDDEERAAKASESGAASLEGIRVPESTMTLCLQALEIAPEIARIGNVNCVSDAGTGAELLLAGLEGAAANVLINLPSLQPEEGIPFRNRVAETRRRGRAVLDEVRRIVGEKLVG